VGKLTGSGGPGAVDFDSSDPSGREVTSRPLLAGLQFVGVITASSVVIRRGAGDKPHSSGDHLRK
jgi:hypothetical protein